MTKHEFIWAVRRITGDKPPALLIKRLRGILNGRYAQTFAEINHNDQLACLLQVITVVRDYQVDRMKSRAASASAELASPGMLLTQ